MSYLSDASATVAEITAGLVAALNATAEPEFKEIIWADTGTTVTATGPADGTPFTQTSSATGGATLTTATTTTGTGPYDWNVAANWSGNTVPITGDDVIIAGPTPDIRYGLSQSAVTLASYTEMTSYTGNIGLPKRNPAGYDEYRPTYLNVKATLQTFGAGTGNRSGWTKFNADIAVCTVNVYSTGQTGENASYEPLLWKGVNASNSFNLVSGVVGIAGVPGDTAQIGTLTVGTGTGGGAAVVRGGSPGPAALTQGVLINDGGTVLMHNTVTTVNQIAGSLTVVGTGAATAINVDGGTLFWKSTGTIANLNVAGGATADFSDDNRPRIVTNCTLQAGASLLDPERTVTFTNPIVLNRTKVEKMGTLDFGTHIAIAITSGP